MRNKEPTLDADAPKAKRVLHPPRVCGCACVPALPGSCETCAGVLHAFSRVVPYPPPYFGRSLTVGWTNIIREIFEVARLLKETRSWELTTYAHCTAVNKLSARTAVETFIIPIKPRSWSQYTLRSPQTNIDSTGVSRTAAFVVPVGSDVPRRRPAPSGASRCSCRTPQRYMG